METPGQHHIAGHGGVGIRVLEYGPAAGVPLLLCHCTGTFARIWEPVIARLGAGYRVLAIDSRGQGDSDQPLDRDAYVWANSGRDVLAVIDALALGHGLLAAGHSGGAAHLAYAEMLRPGTFRKVVLMDAIIGPREVFPGESPLAALVRRRKNTFENLDTARARLRSKPPMNTWTPETLETYLAHAFRTQADGTLVLKCPGDVEAWMYEHGGACDVFERLGELQFEALVVAGAEGYGVDLATGQAERLPHARYVAVPGAGHFIPQEQPDAVAGLLREFLV